MGRTSPLLLALICTSALVVTACSSKPKLVVGSKNFSEQVLLGEILAQQIERRLGIVAERRLNLGGTLLTHQAITSGSVDLYPEYTGTAQAAVLKGELTKEPARVLAQVRAGYRQWGLTWLSPFGFNNTFAMVVRTEAARALAAPLLSAAAQRPAPWKMGVGYEFVQRADGLQGLVTTYGLRLAGDPVAMDLGLLYPALETGKVEIAAASATDGQLARPGFTVLADDKKYFPPYECAVIVRDDALQRFPGLRNALEELSGKITDTQMRKMNAAVDRERRSVVDIAREFLGSMPEREARVR